MTVANATLDVFLSYALTDRDIAEAVERSLVDAGFVVRTATQVSPGTKFERQLRTLLVESDAIVVLVTPNSVKSSSTLVEIGAAMALNMPIHLLLSGLAEKELPDHLRGLSYAHISDATTAGQSLLQHAGSWKLDDDDRVTLANVYQKLGVPVDQLAYNSASLDKLSQKFNKLSGKQIPSSRLLHGLLTLRKRGNLPRLNRRK